MGVLTSGLPTAISVDGEICRIRAGYQNCLKIIMAFEDKELTHTEKAIILLDLLYIDKPKNTQTALEKGILFLDCGEERTNKGETGGEESRKYSFSHDEKYIFAGVNKALNGRLSTGEFVHWWEFVMAFMDLPEDCLMSKIIYYRTQYAKGKLTREEKEVWAKNREIFELPVEMTAEEENTLNKFLSRLKP
jgi:hypothetical protein